MNITIIGIGRLGLCMALCMSKAGYNVVGVDKDKNYIDTLNNKNFFSYEPLVVDYLKQVKSFKATLSIEEGIHHSNIIFICVPTPNGGGTNFYDCSILSSLLVTLNTLKLENKHIIICCTVLPHYIQNIGKILLNDCINTTLTYNPEFIAQGNIIRGLESPDMVLLGTESVEASSYLKDIYNNITSNNPPHQVLSPLEAEIVKISINGYITTKIAYANMIGDACSKCKVDKNKVLNVLGKDSRIGNKYLKPGYSYGGPCFPRDTKALQQFLTNENIESFIPKAAHQSNEFHIRFQAEKLIENTEGDIIIENICYKDDSLVPIIEESAKLKIAHYIVKGGTPVTIKDKYHMIMEVKKVYGNIFKYIID